MAEKHLLKNDVVVWANLAGDERETWVDYEDDGPFLVVHAWKNGVAAVRSLSTGQCMNQRGLPKFKGCGGYGARAFRKDDYLTAVYQRRHQPLPLDVV